MIYLALSILSSTLIFVVFKLFDVYKIQTLYAIITNYVVACTVGFFLYDGPVGINDLTGKPWFIGPVLLGVLFIVIFNLMARTAQVSGVSVASIATKMSLAIPVVMGVCNLAGHASCFAAIVVAARAVSGKPRALVCHGLVANTLPRGL